MFRSARHQSIGGKQGYFVSMPHRKTPDGQYKDVAHPINTDTRELINKVVLEAFEKEKANPQSAE